MWAHVWNRSTLLSQFQWSSTHEKMIRQRFKVPLWWFHSPPSSPFRQHSSCTISARFRSCEELWTLHWQYQLRTRCLQQQHNTMTMAGNKSLVRGGTMVSLLHCDGIGEDPYDRQTRPLRSVNVFVCGTQRPHASFRKSNMIQVISQHITCVCNGVT